MKPIFMAFSTFFLLSCGMPKSYRNNFQIDPPPIALVGDEQLFTLAFVASCKAQIEWPIEFKTKSPAMNTSKRSLSDLMWLWIENPEIVTQKIGSKKVVALPSIRIQSNSKRCNEWSIQMNLSNPNDKQQIFRRFMILDSENTAEWIEQEMEWSQYPEGFGR